MMLFSVACRAEYQYEIIGSAKLMVYKEGLFSNKWRSKRFDGLFSRNTKTVIEGFLPQIDPKLSRFIEYTSRGNCRLYTRNLKGVEFFYYVNNDENKRSRKVNFINVSNRKTYVSFPCERY